MSDANSAKTINKINQLFTIRTMPENSLSSEIIIYQTEDGITKIETRLENETVWLTQAQLAELFQKSRVTITEHIGNIFKEGELSENSVCRKFRLTAAETVFPNGTKQTALGFTWSYCCRNYFSTGIIDELSEVEKQFIVSIENANKELKTINKTKK